MRGVLRRLPDQPRQWDQRQRGQDEERVLADVGPPVQGDDDRPQGQQGVEDPANHGAATLSSAACCAPCSSTGGTPSSTSPTTRSFWPPVGRPGWRTLEREGLPAPEETAAVFRERYLPLLFVPGAIEEIEYPGMIHELLGGFGVEVDGDGARPLPRRGARRLGARAAPRLAHPRAPRLAARTRAPDGARVERVRPWLAPPPGPGRYGARRAPRRRRLLLRGRPAQAPSRRLRGHARASSASSRPRRCSSATAATRTCAARRSWG